MYQNYNNDVLMDIQKLHTGLCNLRNDYAELLPKGKDSKSYNDTECAISVKIAALDKIIIALHPFTLPHTKNKGKLLEKMQPLLKKLGEDKGTMQTFRKDFNAKVKLYANFASQFPKTLEEAQQLEKAGQLTRSQREALQSNLLTLYENLLTMQDTLNAIRQTIQDDRGQLFKLQSQLLPKGSIANLRTAIQQNHSILVKFIPKKETRFTRLTREQPAFVAFDLQAEELAGKLKNIIARLLPVPKKFPPPLPEKPSKEAKTGPAPEKKVPPPKLGR